MVWVTVVDGQSQPIIAKLSQSFSSISEELAVFFIFTHPLNHAGESNIFVNLQWIIIKYTHWSIVGSKLKDDINYFEMEDNLNFLENGRRP